MIRKNAAQIAAVLLLANAVGCTCVNEPLNDATVPLELRLTNHTRAATFADLGPLASGRLISTRTATQSAAPILPDNDGYFVGIAISGGGLRSANYAAACLFQLQRLNLLDKVDYISSVSGGSVVAAYYCLYDESHWNPGTVQRELTHRFGTDVITSAFLPWNAIALMFTNWDSTDILAQSLDKHLYRRNGRSLTFADLRQDRPRLLINATDLQSGNRFMFCNESFDELNSDLSRYPIAHAVAAGSAVPVLLHPKTLRDYSTAFKQYRHFIDGAITDNLGVQSLLDVYQAQNGPRPGRTPPYPNGAVIILIDAGTRYDAKLSDRGDIGFWQKVRRSMDLASTALISRANSATLAELILLHSDDTLNAENLRQHKQRLEQTGLLEILDRDHRPIQVVHLSLSSVRRLSNLPFPSFSESLDNISTFFNIDQTEAYRLYQAADLLLRDDQIHAALEQIARNLARPASQP